MTERNRPTSLRRLHLLAALLGVLALATACGGDDDTETSAGAAADQREENASHEDEEGDGSGGEGDDGGDESAVGPAGTGGFCDDLETYATHSIDLWTTVFSGDAGPDEVRAVVEPLAEDAAKVALSAPEELFDRIQVLNEEMFNRTGAIEIANFDLQAADLMGEPVEGIAEAEERVNDYARTECGFDPDAMADAAGLTG